MWQGFFPRAETGGLISSTSTPSKTSAFTSSKGDRPTGSSWKTSPNSAGPFDIVVNNTSHIPSLTLRSFELLYPFLAPSGIYVIEDLSTSYWPMWGGRFRRRARGTTMDFLKDRLDGLNHAELKLPNVHASALDTSIVEIRARHNMAAIVKGDNTLPSDLNRPNPVTVSEWLKEDVLPAVARSAQRPSVLHALDAAGLRGFAGRVRRRLVPDLHR